MWSVVALSIFGVLVLLVLAMLAAVLLGGGALTAASMAQGDEEREWSALWEGHELTVRAQGERATLYLDGRLVGEGDRIELPVDGRNALVTVDWLKEGPKAQLHIDGSPVTLSRRPFGSPFRVSGAGPALGGKEPDDPRWEPILQLTDQVRAQGGEAAVLASEAREELRRLLLEIQQTEASREAHSALGSGDDALGGVISQLETRADRLIEALRELHAGGLSENAKPGTDAEARLLAGLEVELAERRARQKAQLES